MFKHLGLLCTHLLVLLQLRVIDLANLGKLGSVVGVFDAAVGG